jgi:FHS family L-fucose permease-like MFS transporter
MGMYVAMNFIQNRLNPMSSSERSLLGEAEFAALRDADLERLIEPYIAIGIVIGIIFLLFMVVKMPTEGDTSGQMKFGDTAKRLFANVGYRNGVVAQFFYVGAQIMVWTFIIQYGTRLFTSQGMDEKSAEVLSQGYNIVAMILFCCSRFVCTYLLRFINPGKLLATLAVAAAFFTTGAIALQNIYGLYSLVAISACMSLMFPTIYGIALKGTGEDAKLGAAGLIMAILGGSVLPPVQAMIIDQGTIAGMPAVNLSFVLPLICFVVIAAYGRSTAKATS